MGRHIGTLAAWCLSLAGPACGAGTTETVEPAGGTAARSDFVVDDALEGGLARPEETPAPPAPDAGLPEALVLAERLFEEADLARAARLYEQVAAAPDNGLAGYAGYKLAWCRFNLQEFAAALQALVQVRERLAAPATSQEQALRRATGRDLPLFYATVGRAEAALPFFQRVLAPEDVAPALQSLAEHLWSQGREDDAAIVRNELCRLQPQGCAPGR
ncbi:MAG: hypothetical protein JXB32_11790 [Deltaproteobacteria bacterium]|nr:hypothetical protein [Deltaproteobacteria bacterium]